MCSINEALSVITARRTWNNLFVLHTNAANCQKIELVRDGNVTAQTACYWGTVFWAMSIDRHTRMKCSVSQQQELQAVEHLLISPIAREVCERKWPRTHRRKLSPSKVSFSLLIWMSLVPSELRGRGYHPHPHHRWEAGSDWGTQACWCHLLLPNSSDDHIFF